MHSTTSSAQEEFGEHASLINAILARRADVARELEFA